MKNTKKNKNQKITNTKTTKIPQANAVKNTENNTKSEGFYFFCGFCGIYKKKKLA